MPSDTHEGRTIFVRNLSFDVDNDKLYDFFADFGALEFAKVVKDPVTSHSRGTGFVKFTRAVDAACVLADSCEPQNAARFTLDNRTMHLSMAISREEAQQLKSTDKTTAESADSNRPALSQADHLHQTGRNLHLARVGLIRPGTAAAEGLTAQDLAKREALLHEKKAKLRNPSIFISDLRLCLRNLPLTVADEDLRQICADILGDKGKKRRITECRVMRNLQPGKQQFRSLGYAFVSCSTHEDALKLLNALNNNPDVFKGQRRPIVEFSLENMLALEKKRRRAERCAAIQSKRLSGKTLANPGDRPPPASMRSHKPNPGNRPNKQVPTRILPKRFGPKNRHRKRKGNSNAKKSVKPKGRISRKQKRLKQHMQK
ncbi:nucleolar protein 4 [Clonorchis sinensis]|uniref:Nucleolar protein 4 n=1 Tax=Clonorchis sinensis TaxID=79923 RepID=G7Y550_CLOSI|nr:nucleolar protein 4 [Clonorchis sinensis]